MEQVCWVRDILASIDAGLTLGISPGFRIPPARAVAKAETITQEPIDPAAGQHGAIIRTIHQALLFELSIVTRPAYDQAQVEMRDWQAPRHGVAVPQLRRSPGWRLHDGDHHQAD